MIGKAGSDDGCHPENVAFTLGQGHQRQDECRDGKLIEQGLTRLNPGERAGLDQNGCGPPKDCRHDDHAVSNQNPVRCVICRFTERNDDAGKCTAQSNNLIQPQLFTGDEELCAKRDDKWRNIDKNGGT